MKINEAWWKFNHLCCLFYLFYSVEGPSSQDYKLLVVTKMKHLYMQFISTLIEVSIEESSSWFQSHCGHVPREQPFLTQWNKKLNKRVTMKKKNNIEMVDGMPQEQHFIRNIQKSWCCIQIHEVYILHSNVPPVLYDPLYTFFFCTW